MRVKAITSQAMRLLLKHNICIVGVSNDDIVFSVPGIEDNATSFKLQDWFCAKTMSVKLIIENGMLMLDYERHAIQQKQDNIAFKVVTVGDNVIAVTAMYHGKRYKGVLLIDEG